MLDLTDERSTILPGHGPVSTRLDMTLHDHPMWRRPRHHLDLHGFLIFARLFAAVWFAWADSGMFNSFYVPTDVWHWP